MSDNIHLDHTQGGDNHLAGGRGVLALVTETPGDTAKATAAQLYHYLGDNHGPNMPIYCTSFLLIYAQRSKEGADQSPASSQLDNSVFCVCYL